MDESLSRVLARRSQLVEQLRAGDTAVRDLAIGVPQRIASIVLALAEKRGNLNTPVRTASSAAGARQPFHVLLQSRS